jgi:alkanesulfonate monooxygenase SsuD/methylene tetrahydromethanopterin reductase-like flavin-dependent oxidoreductase (luciferase family)
MESLGAIARMFVENPFLGHEGKYFNMPVRNVVPKPVQKPHPPLWVACSRRETIHLAAKLGIGALTFAFISPEEAKQWVNDYYTTLANECEPIGYAINANIAIVTGFMCDKNEQRAREMGEEGLNFFSYALGHHYFFGQHEVGKTNIWSNFKSNKFQMPGMGGEAACVGTPDQIRKKLREYEEVGVDQVVFISQAGNNQHEDICSSLNLFGKEVLSEFKDREQHSAKKKAERLAPIIEKAMQRKPAVKAPKHDGPTIVTAAPLP